MTDQTNIELAEVEVSGAMRKMIERYPLPDGVEDADVTIEGAAQALNVSVNTVSKWIRQREPGVEAFPVVEQGGMGKSYVLRLSHVFAWKQARDVASAERDRHAQTQIERMQAQFLGLDVDQDGQVLSAKERKALAEADFHHSRAAQMRRQLVPLDEMTDLLESVFAAVRNGVEGMPDRLERELDLKPEEVAMAQRIGSDILSEIAQKIEEAELEERDLADVEIGSRLLI
ncbi:DUF1441 family protein [Shimia aestuarii]|uniref:DUF1441 family protein n=1 Tax=Shimia aestuarii TaxID=254406 RepID=UPI001FB506C5|nr:DUF1441 family protein [Shimia aestuarii]